jgi:hypothetical protein
MLTPVLDGEALERAEATFLCSVISVRVWHPEDLVLPVADTHPLGTQRPAEADYNAWRRTVKTRSAKCC